MIHKMKLQNEPYEFIKKGIKTIELRLYDDKRKQIKIGDTVLFINTKTEKWLATRVKNISIYESFREMFESVEDKRTLGFVDESETIDEMVSDMRKYYSEKKEKENGVVGIEIESPTTEIDFPVECEESELKYVMIAAFYDGKMVFCKQKARDSLDLPGGHIEKGETSLEAARRELYEETGIKDIKSIVPVAAYCASNAKDESDRAYTMLYAAQTEKLPDSMPDFEMEKIELYDITPKRELLDIHTPELPEALTHFEIYSVILYYIQRMLFNDEIDFSCDETDYYTRLKYYEEEVCVDYESFDAESYFCYVMLRGDCPDFVSPLDNVAATEENYKGIRDVLLHTGDVYEFFTLLVEKFGAEKVMNDEKLMSRIYEAFDRELVDFVLGIR